MQSSESKPFFKDYKQVIDFLYNQVPQFFKYGDKAYNPGFENINALCYRLKQPDKKFPAIHIAGTNGKGSTAHIISTILSSNGYRVGLFTSPHIFSFNERIKIDGVKVNQGYILEFMNSIIGDIQEIKPSFFELTVAMAFNYFAKNRVDFAIIETGLGGRLDATNIIKPLISIITNISKDHQKQLGNTLKEIAEEKAGIIKEKIPLVVGKKNSRTHPVFLSRCKQKNTTLYYAQDIYDTKIISNTNCSTLKLTNLNTHTTACFKTDFIAQYQQENIATALATLKILESKKSIKLSSNKGFVYFEKLSGLLGRWQILTKKPTLILDVAHNVAAIKCIQAQIQKIKHQHHQIFIILGFMQDKDWLSCLAYLPSYAHYHLVPIAHNNRALNPQLLYGAMKQRGFKCTVFKDMQESWKLLNHRIHTEDLVLVTGSFFLVSQFLKSPHIKELLNT